MPTTDSDSKFRIGVMFEISWECANAECTVTSAAKEAFHLIKTFRCD